MQCQTACICQCRKLALTGCCSVVSRISRSRARSLFFTFIAFPRALVAVIVPAPHNADGIVFLQITTAPSTHSKAGRGEQGEITSLTPSGLLHEDEASVATRIHTDQRPVDSLSHEYCEQAFDDKKHVFHGMWSERGLIEGFDLFALSQGRFGQKCWEGMQMDLATYLKAVRRQNVLGNTCDREWSVLWTPEAFAELHIRQQSTSIVLGNDEDIAVACSPEGCERHGLYQLILVAPFGIAHWNMCRNLEFVACGAMGAMPKQNGASIFLATAPHDLHPEEIVKGFQQSWTMGFDQYWGTSVITLLEYCLLDQLCSNRQDFYNSARGQYFNCIFNESALFALLSKI